MATLLPEPKEILRDRLFYNQWQYCSKFVVRESGILHTLNHDEIDRSINWRNRHRQIHLSITDKHRKILHDIADVLANTTIQYKRIHGWMRLYIYSNQLDLTEELNRKVGGIMEIQKSLAVVPPDVLYRKNPKFKFRSYLKQKKLTLDQIEQLKDYMTANLKDLHLGPAFHHFLHGMPSYKYPRRSGWTMNHFYIDYDSEHWVTMIGLKFPGLIQKTMVFQNK